MEKILVLIAIVFSTGFSARAMEAWPGPVAVPKEVVLQLVTTPEMSAQESLSNLTQLACVNRQLRKTLNDDTIIETFYELFSSQLSEKISSKSGDNIAHLLARYRKYTMLSRFIELCVRDNEGR